MANEKKIIVEENANPEQVSQRIAIFPERLSARFEKEKPPEKLVMSFPHLIIREVICLQLVVIVVALIALFFNAPLEEMANPLHTPNPAKAPWYFLGLQELLHAFPPVVAGVLIPFMVVVALVVIPYFKINIKREGLWLNAKHQTFIIFTLCVWAVILLTMFMDAFSVAVPSIILYSLAVMPYFIKKETRFLLWLGRRSLTEWIMIWFVTVATVLTLIGTFFRGPSWSWVWPWR